MYYPDELGDSKRLYGWTDWYRFARDELGYAHDESTVYANLRFVEEQNRDVLRGGGAGSERPRSERPKSERSSLPYD
jgi:hypothetical protein